MSLIHLADRTRLHGIRCNHKGDTERTDEEWRVTCSMCRGLGRPIEQAPDNAMRINSYLPVTDLNGGERGVLNLHNVIFVEGGSLIWFEEPDTLAVMQATRGGVVDRYQGTWERAQSESARKRVITVPGPDRLGADSQ